MRFTFRGCLGGRCGLPPERAAVILVALVLAGSAVKALGQQAEAAAEPVPLVPEGEPSPHPRSESERLFRLDAAEAALEQGFGAIAENLFRDLLESAVPDGALEERIRVGLADALIARGRFEEVLAVLPEETSVGDESAWTLRRALALLQAGSTREAERAIDRVRPANLAPTRLAWYYAARGLIADSRGRYDRAAEAYRQAEELAVSDAQRALLTARIYRGQLLGGRADESLAAELRQRLNLFKGQPAGFQFARQLALVLDKLGRREEAVSLIQEQLRFLTAEQRILHDQFLLLMGLIAGPDSASGKLALKNLLRREAERRFSRTALTLLADQALTSAENRADFAALLDELLDRANPHPLADDLLFLKARFALEARRLDEAAEAANQLLERYPGSPLVPGALRQQAFVAYTRDPPQYRTAANILLRWRESTDDPRESGRISLLVGDCFFLNGDWSNAAGAYREAVEGLEGEALYSRAFYQLVESRIREGRFDEARQALDAALADAASTQSLEQLTQWRAEWNLVASMARAGQVASAFNRINALLEQAYALRLPEPLRLRFLWLQAWLSVDAGQVSETPYRADRILAELGALPTEAIGPELRALLHSHTLLLKGRALLAQGQSDEAFAIFREIRTSHPDSEPAMMTFLHEARFHASVGQSALARERLLALVDRYPDSEYAPEALFEAALNAERRSTNEAFRDAIGLFERVVAEYSADRLVFHARMHQGELLRKLSDFGAALLVYDDAISRFPDHPERYRAEIARGDCFLAQASQSPTYLEDAAVIFERLFELPRVDAPARAEAGYKWGFALERLESFERAREVYWLNLNQGLEGEGSAAAPADPNLRFWLARTALALGALFEREGALEEARRVYRMIEARGLPGGQLARSRLDELEPRPNPG